MKRFGMYFVGLTILAALLAVLFWRNVTTPTYFRSPSGPPLNEVSYERIMDPGFKKGGQSLEFLESLVLKTNTTGVFLEGKRKSNQESYTDNTLYDYYTFKPGESFEDDTGSVGLKYIGLAYGPIPDEDLNEYQTLMPGTFYRPDGTPLSEEAMSQWLDKKWDRELGFEGRFPSVKFGFEINLKQEFKVLGYAVLDPQFKRTLQNNYSSGGRESMKTLEAQVRMWHPVPIDVVMDLAMGPVEVIEFGAQTGKSMDYPLGTVRLAAMVEGMENRSSSQDGLTMTLQFTPVTEDDLPLTSVILVCTPQAHPIPLNYEFLDHEGGVLETRGRGTSGQFVKFEIKGKVKDIATVRCKYYPDLKRLIFRVPELPGLPAENQSVANLFDVKIPYLRIQYEYQFSETLEALMGLKITRPATPFNATYPIVHQNISVEELLDVYLKGFGPQSEAWIDWEDMRLNIQDGSVQAKSKRLMQWMKKTFNP